MPDYKLSAEVEMEAKSYDKGIEDAQKTIDNFQQKCSQANQSLKATTGSFQENCSRIGESLTSMGKTATLAAAPITVALTAIGSKAVSTAIDFTKLYESTMVVFEKMLGGKDAANALYASLLDVAKASTYSQETFLAAGKSLVGVGVSAEDTVRYLQAITDATAGFGGTSETIMRLSEAFKKIVTNGKISMMEMNMLSDAGVNALAILGNQYEVTTEEMRKMIADGALPAGEALAKLSEGIENGTNGANGMTSAMGGMAQAMKGGTLSGAFDGINSSIRAFSLSLVGINPTLKETDAAYEESQQRIQQLTAAVTTISEIIPLLAKVFSGVTSAIGNVLDALVGTNMYLDESTKKWTNVNGALGNFKRYLEATPADKLAVIGNGLVLIAATGPVLMVAGAALKGLSAVMAATAAVTKTAANAQLTYTMLVNSSTAATKVATVATSALRAAQITLNAAMLTNPAGVALLAIVALVGGVLALKVAYDSLNAGNESVTAATKAQGEEVDELRGKYESLKESTGESSEETLKAKAALDAAEESYRKIYQTMDSFIAESDAVIQKHQEMMAKMDDTVSAADEEAGSLLALGDRLSELSGHVEGDTAKKAELSAVVSALNGEIEGLNIVINEQTGEIEGSTEAVYGLIKAEANRIQSKANYEKLAEAIKQESALIDQLAEAQENLSVASKEAVVGHDQFGNEIVFVESEADKCQKTIDDLTGQIEVNRAEQEKAVSVLEKVASKEAALEQAVNAVKDGHLGAADAAAKYSNANNDIVITAEEVTEKLEVVKQEIDENVQAIKDYAAANPAFERAMENAGFSADTLNSHLGDLELEFDDLSAKFEECVTDISSGLEVLDTNSQISLSKLVENLRINAEATSNWKDNCMAVWNSVPAELEPAVQSMIEAGPDKFGLAMQQLAGLSEEELTDMVRQMAGYTDSTTQSLADLLMQTSEFGATLAQNLRLPDGSLNYTAIAAALNSAGFDATAIASLTSDQIAAALGIDPSEIDMSQITAAVQSEEPKAVDASAEAGGNSGEAYSDANTEGIESRKSQVASAAVSVISNAATTAAPIASTGGYMVGTNLGLGIASGLRGSSGLITAASVSAVNNAVAAAKRAGEIHSPSRRTEREIGKQMIAGAARGVTRNSHLFESAMAHSVNRSIDAVPINTNMRTRVVPAFNTSALQGSSAVMTRRDVSDAVTTAFGNLGFAEMGVYIDEDKLIGYTAKKTDRALGKIKRNSGGL